MTALLQQMQRIRALASGLWGYLRAGGWGRSTAAVFLAVALFVLGSGFTVSAQSAQAPALSEWSEAALQEQVQLLRSVQEALRWLVLRSPVIFSGEVLTSTASGDESNPVRNRIADASIATVGIRVDHAIRGVRTVEIFLLSQWRGADALALFPHERVILFLHQQNAAGVTSSAAGSFGLLGIGGGDLVDLRSLRILERQVGTPSTRDCAPLDGIERARPIVAMDPLPCARDFSTVGQNLRTGSSSIPAKQLIGAIEQLATPRSRRWDGRVPAEAANAP